MSQLKQRTVEGVTVTLHKLRGDGPGGFTYEIRLDGQFDEAAQTRSQADRLFRSTLQQLKRGASSERSQRQRSGGLLGGGSPGGDLDPFNL